MVGFVDCWTPDCALHRRGRGILHSPAISARWRYRAERRFEERRTALGREHPAQRRGDRALGALQTSSGSSPQRWTRRRANPYTGSGGVYEDEIVRTDRGWRFSVRRFWPRDAAIIGAARATNPCAHRVWCDHGRETPPGGETSSPIRTLYARYAQSYDAGDAWKPGPPASRQTATLHLSRGDVIRGRGAPGIHEQRWHNGRRRALWQRTSGPGRRGKCRGPRVTSCASRSGATPPLLRPGVFTRTSSGRSTNGEAGGGGCRRSSESLSGRRDGGRS